MNLKRPILWLYVGAGLIFLYSTMKLFAVVGPSVVLGAIGAEQGMPYFAILKMGFETYVQEVAKKFNQTPQYVNYAFISSAIISFSFTVTSIFIVFRQNWARILFLVLVGVVAANYVIVAILFGVSRISSGMDMSNLIFFGCLVWLFTRKEVCSTFAVKKADITRE
ncbi:MAG: hypothetical protein JJE30_13675 [Desulfuromonadales bacterium]|nr:hypothetical protein [Desulfuromonadales bacterium]